MVGEMKESPELAEQALDALYGKSGAAGTGLCKSLIENMPKRVEHRRRTEVSIGENVWSAAGLQEG
jgi:hypothetical protein